MRRPFPCFFVMGVILVDTCACVFEAPMLPSTSQAPVTTNLGRY